MSEAGHVGDAISFVFGKFQLDVAGRKLWLGEHLVELNWRALEALVMLVRHRDRVVTKEELIKTIWRDSFVSDDSLTQCIWSLRRALGDDASQHQFVATLPRQGYRFVAPVRIVPAAGETVEPTPPRLAPQEVEAPVALPTTTPVANDVAVLPRRWGRAAVGTAAAGAAALVVALLWGAVALTQRPAAVSLGSIRTVLDSTAGTRMMSDAVVSPDSRQVTFTAQDEDTGRTRLWVRVLSSGEARALTGTDGASRPFWSPRSDAIGFFANGRLKIAGLEGANVRTLADVGLNPAGGSWSRNGGILFARFRSGLTLVSDHGDQSEPVTTLEVKSGDVGHRWPQFLPDGRHFIFTIVSSDKGRTGTYLGALDGPAPTRLLDTPNTFALFVDSGHLLYVRDDTLFAQSFDLAALRPLGSGRAIATNVLAPGVLDTVAISATAGGLLTFHNGYAGGRLVWFDRRGTRLGTVDTPVPLHNLSLSPDGRELLAETIEQNSGALDGVWRLDLVRGTSTRIRTGGSPFWSKDGSKIAFVAPARSTHNIYLASLTSGSEDELLLRTPEPKTLADWSGDGRYMLYWSNGNAWLFPLFGQKQPSPFVVNSSSQLQLRLSPDGRWLAYTSNESGRWEIYVQPFPAAGTKSVVSAAGGSEARWRADGRELFFVAPDNTLMSAAVLPGPTWQNAEPRPLFKVALNGGESMLFRSRYQITADGNRFLMDTADDSKTPHVTLVVNWLAAFER